MMNEIDSLKAEIKILKKENKLLKDIKNFFKNYGDLEKEFGSRSYFHKILIKVRSLFRKILGKNK